MRLNLILSRYTVQRRLQGGHVEAYALYNIIDSKWM